MTLKRQLLLVSLLTLMLPWAGCQFIRETESALRTVQQQMLAGNARAFANSMTQYIEEFPKRQSSDHLFGNQLYGHALDSAPVIDGYLDDWAIDTGSPRELRGADGSIKFVIGISDPFVFLYVDVPDSSVIYTDGLPGSGGAAPYGDRIRLISANPPYLEETFIFAAEAPGLLPTYIQNANAIAAEPTIRAYWQDVPGGYHLEARIPRRLLGTHLGLVVENTDSATAPGVRSSSFSSRAPGAFVTTSPELTDIADRLVQEGMRLIVTDAAGWRIANVGSLSRPAESQQRASWTPMRLAYDAIVESGTEARFAEPDPGGREQQAYIAAALNGRRDAAWFRGDDGGRAIVAVAEPVILGGQTVGAVVLQQGTDAILSLTNQGLALLMNVTLIAVIVVALILLGYASWLSRRIGRLSTAAESALESDQLRAALPSSKARDEIGDLSRSFSSVLSQLGDYNEYLRTLASKLSHELRTPLAIVTSSLENLEHEQLDEASRGYTSRAKDGADRLRRILSAMSEASRVEELMKNVETESFDLASVLESTVRAYGDAYPTRQFVFDGGSDGRAISGSPELVIQMLDKLVDNAVGFSNDNDGIRIALTSTDDAQRLDVENPGPPLPGRMQNQLFDSMISLRPARDNQHLGLGLYVAKLIADGHGGRIDAENIEGGVRFSVWFPATTHPDT